MVFISYILIFQYKLDKNQTYVTQNIEIYYFLFIFLQHYKLYIEIVFVYEYIKNKCYKLNCQHINNSNNIPKFQKKHNKDIVN